AIYPSFATSPPPPPSPSLPYTTLFRSRSLVDHPRVARSRGDAAGGARPRPADARRRCPRPLALRRNSRFLGRRRVRRSVLRVRRSEEHTSELQSRFELVCRLLLDKKRLPGCPGCDALLRVRVVWVGEQLPWTELRRVEAHLLRGASAVEVDVGTTADSEPVVVWVV